MRPLTEQVAVDGGSLTVHRLTSAPEGAPVVVALHSISSNALAWVPVAERLEGRAHLLAPHMRGRAESAHLRSTGLATHPQDVGAVVLVDGGLAFPSPGSFDVDEVLHSIIGPPMDRLSMTFEDQAAYLAHWGAHPPSVRTSTDPPVRRSRPTSCTTSPDPGGGCGPPRRWSACAPTGPT